LVDKEDELYAHPPLPLILLFHSHFIYCLVAVKC